MHISDAENLVPTKALPYLGSVVKGYDIDIHTPLFEGSDIDEEADHLLSMLEQSDSVFSELFEVEVASRAKIGPISVRLPFADRQSGVESYYTSRIDVNERVISEYDVSSVIGGLSSRLRPMNYEHASRLLPRNTNSGLPLFSKRGEVLEQSLVMAKSWEPFPAMLGWRGQADGNPEFGKQRVVWMFPLSWNIIESRYSVPLFDMLVSQNYFGAWISMDSVDDHITRFFDSTDDDSFIVSTDYSRFDQTLVSQISWFEDVLKRAFQSSYHHEIEALLTNLQTIPLVCTKDIMYTGTHGMPSGSAFTNIGDSIVNLYAQTSSPVVVRNMVQVQGDDGVAVVTDPDNHISHLMSCGFDMNHDKQLVSRNEVSYLQRHHYRDYKVDGISRGIYPIMRAYNSLRRQERFHREWNKDLEALRTLSILENTKWHPFFQQFVNYVVKFGDTYLHEFVKSMALSNSMYERVIDQARSIPGFQPSYNSDSITGLRTFASFEAVKEI